MYLTFEKHKFVSICRLFIKISCCLQIFLFLWITKESYVLHSLNAHQNLTEEQLQKVFEEYEIKPKTIKLFPLKTDRSSSGLLEFDNVSQAVEALMLCNHTPIQKPRGDGICGGHGMGYLLGSVCCDDIYRHVLGRGGYGDHYPITYDRYGLKGDAPFGRDAPHPLACAGFGPPIISQPSLGDPDQSAGQQGFVMMVYGLDGDKVNADKLFNLFCLYGNVVRIKYLKTKDGTAMIRMGDGWAVERSIQHLNNVNLFNGKLHLEYGLKGDTPFGRDAPHPPARAGFGPPIILQPSLGDPSQSAAQKISVMMVYGHDGDKVNADKLFNLFCLYGNVVRIKYLKTKDGTAMIRMGDGWAVERSIQHLNNVNLFNGKLHLEFSKQAFLSNMVNPSTPSDKCPFKDFMGSENSFINPVMASKNRIQPPLKIKCFMVVLLLCIYGCVIVTFSYFLIKRRSRRLPKFNISAPGMMNPSLGMLNPSLGMMNPNLNFPNFPTVVPLYGIKGIRNFDLHSCWLIVLTQLLASIRAFQTFVLTGNFGNCSFVLKEATCVFMGLGYAIYDIWMRSFRWNKVVDIRLLRLCVAQDVAQLRIGGGKNIETSLHLILDELEKNLSEQKELPYWKKVANYVLKFLNYELYIPDKNTNFIQSVFNGRYFETRECSSCHYTGKGSQSFRVFEVTIYKTSPYTLQELIREAGSIMLPDGRSCNRCDRDTTSRRVIVEFPVVLIILVNRIYMRINGRMQINNQKVNIPLTLTLKDDFDNDVRYVVRSFNALYYVTPVMGHTVVYVRHPENNSWWIIDDNKIQATNLANFSGDVNFLVYERL